MKIDRETMVVRIAQPDSRALDRDELVKTRPRRTELYSLILIHGDEVEAWIWLDWHETWEA
ncbi:hypothetical protein AC579_1081 [Pseudocercospora musae]|uniref:Uncharacterized protein n=1 Tax=Pseudocercospora musae TaxID=113226 RepID=A0A139I0V1_9PEZI|nr:hypothetical protein AC579_1081 [Pseudocercospora musae]